MRKLFFAASIVSLALFSTSCKKETTCICKTYEIESDGSRTETGESTTRVVDQKDADCSQFNEFNENPIGNDTEVKCEEEVFD